MHAYPELFDCQALFRQLIEGYRPELPWAARSSAEVCHAAKLLRLCLFRVCSEAGTPFYILESSTLFPFRIPHPKGLADA